jgi:hypothetical protein
VPSALSAAARASSLQSLFRCAMHRTVLLRRRLQRADFFGIFTIWRFRHAPTRHGIYGLSLRPCRAGPTLSLARVGAHGVNCPDWRSGHRLYFPVTDGDSECAAFATLSA